MGVARVANQYFSAITAKDPEGIKAVFAENAELITVTGKYRGPDAIAEFYVNSAFRFAKLMPKLGPFIVDGDRLAVEIELSLDGTETKVADFFTIQGGKIERLVVYIAPGMN